MPSVNAGPATTQTPNASAVMGAPPTRKLAAAGLGPADSGLIVETTDTTSATMTIAPVSAGWNVQVIQAAAGQITFAAGQNVTIVQADALTKTAKQWASVSLYCDQDNRIVASGYMA